MLLLHGQASTSFTAGLVMRKRVQPSLSVLPVLLFIVASLGRISSPRMKFS